MNRLDANDRRRRRRRMRPALTALEDRRLLSMIVVNDPTDTPVMGEIDLRQAIGMANTDGGGDTIAFDSSVFSVPQTISIALGAALITLIDYRLEIAIMTTATLLAAAYLLTREREQSPEVEPALAA